MAEDIDVVRARRVAAEQQKNYAANYGPDGTYGETARADYRGAGSDAKTASEWVRQWSQQAMAKAGTQGGMGGVQNQLRSWGAGQNGGHDEVWLQAHVMPRSTETFEAWRARVDAAMPGFSTFAMSSPDWQRFRNMSFPANAPGGKTHDEWSQTGMGGTNPQDPMAATRSKIAEFAAALSSPLDPNDPEMQAIMRTASSRASDQARLQGVQGPMSVANSEQSMNNAGAGYNMQRKQLGLQALGLQGQTDMHAAEMGLRERMHARDTLSRSYQDQLGAQALQSERDMAPWKTALGVGSAVVGGLGTIMSGGALLPAVLGAGGALASSFGGGGNGGLGGGSPSLVSGGGNGPNRIGGINNKWSGM